MTSARVKDEAASDPTVAPVQYEITSFGADYDVEGLVRRLDRGDIFIPPFQRDYVWNINEASRFVESLLLGLPVPGIFLARDDPSKKLLVIDGQQRLKSLLFFVSGYFNPRPDAKSKKVFQLTRVQEPFNGLTYEQLRSEDKRILSDSIIHATIVRQDSPRDDDTSIYHIFERLNTSGRKLSPQQIRVAIYHGSFIEFLHETNLHSNWRSIFGRPSPTLKDQELILRFLALYFDSKTYRRPMKEFLNSFISVRRDLSKSTLSRYRRLFARAIDTVYEALGRGAFRPERALNAAVFDAVMTGLAHRLDEVETVSPVALRSAYKKLLANKDFQQTYLEGTARESNVESRLSMALDTFAGV